ncbi:MAG: sugar-binding protein [Propionibacteriaceae bacterium]|jgi:putative multiple sugar transport system substrate-binding protein|nr:sugar-binding protein [Propionibacteriaceae bacterium]
MNKVRTTLLVAGAVSALVLTGCGSNDRGSSTATTSGAATSTATAATTTGAPSGLVGNQLYLPGFAAGSTVGISLPQKTSENWVLAEGLFNNGLKAAGYTGIVSFADGGVTEQQNQIQAQIEQKAKVIVIGAIDGSQLGTQLEAAKQSGASIIAYDRLLMNTQDVDLYIAYDNCKVGTLQGTALLEGLQASGKPSPWNVELIAGSPDDANSLPFFDCAMKVLQPKIDDGTLKIPSGQTTREKVATQGWLAANVQTRFDAIMSGYYTGDTTLNGILSPNDTLARAAVTSVEAAGKPDPVVTGQDSEVESINWIAQGKQYSTINKDTNNLVAKVIDTINTIQKGQPVAVNDTSSYDNGVKVVPALLLEPVIVTKANLCTAYDPSTAAGQAAAATDLCKKG